ncbi:hypothetical protein [Streptococcus pneumoniae]|uniref:hypothetical protein n=1 Tax=Streptococcus pneumoniae TaxID=1313 RepID=UPI002A91F610|nr:hypothetical protein [Streptococcus pneumoniae]MDY6729639.1 hypothetical protein [Streptococcus pneumoniae]
MEWTDWVDWKPETKTDIKIKIENDGYTFPHYDKKNNGVKYVISTMDIKEFVNENRENLFEMAGFKGVLE